MCLSLCICLQLPMQITSHKHAKEKGSLDYVGSDGLEGQTKTHLETIRDTKHTKRGKLQEGVRGRVKNRHPWGSSPAADCWSVFVMASHTYKRTNSPWRASPCHSLPNHARLISCQSFCTAVLKRGTGHEERAHEMDEGMVVKLLPSTIKLPLCNAILTWHIKRSESRPASSFSLPE